MTDTQWNVNMADAPRDGRSVWLHDPDGGTFLMKWNPEMTNPIFCPFDKEGIWVALDGSFTWGTGIDGKSGPTGWLSLSERTHD